MDQFNVLQIPAHQSYFAGACVLYPGGIPSQVCIEVADTREVIGCVTYQLDSFSSEATARQLAINAFLDSGFAERIIADGGTYDGGTLSYEPNKPMHATCEDARA